MFRVVMLPARQGDCIWLEYGDAREPRRVMVDGGPLPAAADIMARLPDAPVRFELLAITHVDADHIGGVLKFLTNLPENVTFGDVWFNAWKHLPTDLLGPAQGEMMSAIIDRREVPWNKAFKGKAACIPGNGKLPTLELDGGMLITLLSPSKEELRKLRPVWKKDAEGAGITPGSTEAALELLRERMAVPPDLLGGDRPNPARDADSPFVSDNSEANGSSLVLLAEFEDKKVLLCGDAYASVVKRGIARLGLDGKLKLAALKLGHHGSRKSTDSELIQRLNCRRYLVSTDGSYYNHPDNEALSRVVVYGRKQSTLFFNYSKPQAKRWANRSLRDKYGYKVVFPATGSNGLAVTL
jgi:hypothetical protein